MTGERPLPYVSVAAFCDSVITEANGTLSLIRVVDRITHRLRSDSPPETFPEFQHQIWYVLAIKTGPAEGKHSVRIQFERPNQEPQVLIDEPEVLLASGEGATFAVQMALSFSSEGQHWMSIDVDGSELTRTPLSVVYDGAALGSDQV